MNKTEAESYFENIRMKVFFMKNYIDYDNIDRPIQTIEGNNMVYQINVRQREFSRIFFQSHIFSDNISRL